MKKADPLLREKWEERIEARKKSGQSCRAWCRENKIGYSSFQYWNTKLRQAQSSTSTESGFIELKNSLEGPFKEIEVVVGNISLRVPDQFNEKTLLRLLHVLGGSA